MLNILASLITSFLDHPVRSGMVTVPPVFKRIRWPTNNLLPADSDCAKIRLPLPNRTTATLFLPNSFTASSASLPTTFGTSMELSMSVFAVDLSCSRACFITGPKISSSNWVAVLSAGKFGFFIVMYMMYFGFFAGAIAATEYR